MHQFALYIYRNGYSNLRSLDIARLEDAGFGPNGNKSFLFHSSNNRWRVLIVVEAVHTKKLIYILTMGSSRWSGDKALTASERIFLGFFLEYIHLKLISSSILVTIIKEKK